MPSLDWVRRHIDLFEEKTEEVLTLEEHIELAERVFNVAEALLGMMRDSRTREHSNLAGRLTSARSRLDCLYSRLMERPGGAEQYRQLGNIYYRRPKIESAE